MERDKQSKPNKRSGSKLLKLLPRAAASGVSFQNPPFSPGRSSESNNIKRSLTHTTSSLDPNFNHSRMKSHIRKGFSGPLMVSIIPTEARRRPKGGESADFDTSEPVSPKVSCIGRIKHKKKGKPEADGPRKKRPSPPTKQASAIRRIFGGGRKQGRAGEMSTSSRADAAPELARLPDRAPALGQMRRFTSGRDALAGFDWSEVQVAPVDSEQRNCHSDEEDHRKAREEKEEENEEEEEEEDDHEVMIPFSAPILMGGGGGGFGVGGVKDLQPRKEINLWKRRTMAPPRPLRLHPSNGKS